MAWKNGSQDNPQGTGSKKETEPFAIKRVGKSARQRINQKATQRIRYKRTITKIVRKALKRRRRKLQESNNLGTRPPGSSPSCGTAGDTGPSKRARPDKRKSTISRSKTSQCEEREIERS